MSTEQAVRVAGCCGQPATELAAVNLCVLPRLLTAVRHRVTLMMLTMLLAAVLVGIQGIDGMGFVDSKELSALCT